MTNTEVTAVVPTLGADELKLLVLELIVLGLEELELVVLELVLELVMEVEEDEEDVEEEPLLAAPPALAGAA